MSSRTRKRLIPVVLGFVIEAIATWLRSHRLGGSLLVRCRQRHLFTTIWIPGASLKALRLGFWRVQYCPVGRHWDLVTPVVESDLSRRERRAARAHHDIRIP